MLRVYYAYARRAVTDPLYIYGFLLGLSAVLLTQFVSLTGLINTLVQIEIGHLPNWAYNAFTTTETATLILLGIIIFTGLSLRFKLRLPRAEAQVKTV